LSQQQAKAHLLERRLPQLIRPHYLLPACVNQQLHLTNNAKTTTSKPPTTTTMRLTAELITSSLSYLNPLKERELDLRGAFATCLKRAEHYTL